MQQSVLDKLDDKISIESSKENVNNDSDTKSRELKKEKKRKKHKKEKKAKKQKKAKNKIQEKFSQKINIDCNHPVTAVGSISTCTVKDTALQDESDDSIKTKFPLSFHEIERKLDKIEKLSVKIDEPEKRVKHKLASAINEKQKSSKDETVISDAIPNIHFLCTSKTIMKNHSINSRSEATTAVIPTYNNSFLLNSSESTAKPLASITTTSAIMKKSNEAVQESKPNHEFSKEKYAHI